MPESSHAAVFTGADNPLELRRFPLPELKAGEALIRITCCTICGSDLHTYEGRRTTPLPTILGHEILGEVVALPAVAPCDVDGKKLSVGDRVTWSIAASCGECFYCTHDLPAKCDQLFKYGHEAINQQHPLSGGLSQYCHLTAGTAIVRIPSSLPDAVACPANCATATVVAALRIGGGCINETVLIQGAGMLGLSATALMASGGAKQIIVSDINPERLAQAVQFGATHTVSVADEDGELAEVIAKATGGRGVDLAIELSGAADSIQSGLQHLRMGGRYVLVGSVFPAPDVPVSAEWIVRRWLTIRGVHNYAPEDLRDAVLFLEEAHTRYPLESLVSKNFRLADAEQAVRYAIREKPHRVAVVPFGDN
ncbi:MAG: alcohol dehydrogenase [Planctomycetaceae bacterium]|nr:alcohol dehydrogenase [Planctomycetaceae bacterium]|tara:strand:- start:2942 stop:4042 length:1101 start_codon:yes stop_codon:yes gene_type:complete